MKILITGVAGFIGSNLSERLLACNQAANTNYRIIGIDNLSFGVREQIPPGVEFHQIDIRSKDIYSLFKGVDVVFHLAAKNCINDCQENPVETFDINVTGTANLFEAAKKAEVKKVVCAESSAIYEGTQIFPTPESENKPESFYAVSKVASMYLTEAYKRFSNLQFTALRYFNVYGPKQDYRRTIPPLMSAFIIKLLKGEPPIIYGTGEKRRDYVYVDDVNDFHLLCMNDSRTDGKIFNIGSGKNYSVLEIYELISKRLGEENCPIHKPDLPGEAQDNLADISEAVKIGWSPKTQIAEGIEKNIKYLKEEIEKRNI